MKEKASHSFKYVLIGRNIGILSRKILHCTALLRHLSILASRQQKASSTPIIVHPHISKHPLKEVIIFLEHCSSREAFFIKK